MLGLTVVFEEELSWDLRQLLRHLVPSEQRGLGLQLVLKAWRGLCTRCGFEGPLDISALQ